MPIESIAVIPPQPNREQYGVADIAVFKTFNRREDYREAFGEDPPWFDPKRQPKTWFDSAAAGMKPNRWIIYKVVEIQADGTADIVDFPLQAHEAATVNIVPGNEPGNFGLTPEMVAAQQAPHIPVPVRELLNNEALKVDPFAGVLVINTDKRFAKDEAEGKFLPSDRALLKAIARKLEM